MQSSFVIAIAGASGCGKTTLVKAVAERLGDAACLFFDDWADDPPDFDMWGRQRPLELDYNRWKTPEFAQALATLRGGKAVELPQLSPSVGIDRNRITEPAAHIVVEEPFGRLRDEMAQLVDFVVFIDAPLHIALARRLQRQLATAVRAADADAEGAAKTLRSAATMFTGFLDFYTDWGHSAYEEQCRLLRGSVDLVIDGMRGVDELSAEICRAVNASK